jgi:hypothetical protein
MVDRISLIACLLLVVLSTQSASERRDWSTCDRCGAAYLHEHPEADPAEVAEQKACEAARIAEVPPRPECRPNWSEAVSDHYILEGKTPVKTDLMTWARWFETQKDRHVAQTGSRATCKV